MIQHMMCSKCQKCTAVRGNHTVAEILGILSLKAEEELT
jgi:hypothetical protein